MSRLLARICFKERENCQVWGFKHRLATAVALLSQGFPKWRPPNGWVENQAGSGGVDPTALARRAQKGRLMGGASGNAGSPGVSRLGHPQHGT